MNLVNLTPHEIALANEAGEIERIIFSKGCARVGLCRRVVGDLNGFPIRRIFLGEIQGLPDPEPDTVYIVSSLVAQKAVGREDVLAPDSGPSAVRYPKGHPLAGKVKAVRGFVREVA